MPTSPASGPTCLPRSGSGFAARPQRCSPLEHPRDNTVTGMHRFVEAVSRTAPRSSRPARPGIRPRRVRRAGELRARVGDPDACGAGSHRPRRLRARPLLRSRRPGPLPDAGARLRLPRRGLQAQSAVAIARERARDLPCRFEVAQIPPLPPGTFDVVLLLETMLAFRDKEALLREVARALPAGGRFAFTLEEGAPLTESERARMPAADTVWLIPLDEMHALLARAGLAVRWEEDWSESHRDVAAALADAYAADSTAIASRIGRAALDELLAAHRLWSEWLATRPRPQVRARRRATDPIAARSRSETSVMTFRTESRITIAGSVAEVWAYLCDVGRWPEWAPTVLECSGCAAAAPSSPARGWSSGRRDPRHESPPEPAGDRCRGAPPHGVRRADGHVRGALGNGARAAGRRADRRHDVDRGRPRRASCARSPAACSKAGFSA